jgi:hypothetical protein
VVVLDSMMPETVPWAEALDVMRSMGCMKDGMVEERCELVDIDVAEE